MSKFKEITNGFKNLIWENPRVEKIAMDRAVICGTCDDNVNGRCQLCGCIIIAKIRSEYSCCPASKWEKTK
jgi:hypothetical protein